ncbi:phosphoribosylglycinamide formyltransferase [Endozoicomonas sp. (ex Bugula neritina AB1)]|nr:phosphoribosylglycinamide formyltransferase [Endozoicomonas sp. (ex Bugula neritina AB1)]
MIDQNPAYSYKLVAVLSNRPEALGLERARQHNIPALTLDHTTFPDRETFDLQLIKEIDNFKPDLVVLAGYMRILSTAFVKHYENRLINIHPSLLPDYKGMHTYRRVLEDQQKQHGTTVHYVTPELDSGAQLLQASLTINPADTEDSLRRRVQAMEHQIYPLAVHLITSGRLTIKDSIAYFDNKPLSPQGYQLREHALEIR